MRDKKNIQLQTLLKETLSSEASSFYRDHFGITKAPHIQSFDDIAKLPSLSFEQLRNYPFLKRLYKDKELLVMIGYRNDLPLLTARTTADIKEETYGQTACARPLVLFPSIHENLEKCFWFYEHNILPQISDTDPRITAAVAARYGIDAIVAAIDSLKETLPALTREYDTALIRYVTIVDTVFDLPFLQKYFPNASLELICAMPEVGTIGRACPEYLERGELAFHPHEHTIVETDFETCVVTRLLNLPTPLIRYETNLQAQKTDSRCSCAETEAFVLS